MRDIFTKIYHENYWKDKQSVSGRGSTKEATEAISLVLPQLIHELGITNMLDIPCGDCNWIQYVDFPDGFEYYGADIVPEVVDLAREKMRGTRVWFADHFAVADASTDRLPQVDLIFCRDMLGHLTNAEVMRTLKNFRASGSKYLLTTTFPGRNPNVDIKTGEWRPIDIEALRFGMGPAQLLINEGSIEGNGKFNDKSLGLWEL